jgi:hypothetical protein
MVTRTLQELVRDLENRRRLGDLPPVVLLGAGASIESGIEAMDGLFKLVNCDNFAQFVAYIDTRDDSERYRLLSDFLQTRDPAAVTPGYQALASLCAAKFFDIVLTTNLDPLMDDALAAARLWRRDYLLMVNGVLRPDRLEPLLRSQSPRVKVLKLHGDLFHRFMAWTPREMDAYLNDISRPLQYALRGRDFLVVGHSLRDERVRELVLAANGAVWYVSPGAVPDQVAGLARLRAVTGAGLTFESLFPSMAQALGVAYEMPTAAVTSAHVEMPLSPEQLETAATLDDLLNSLVAIAAGDGIPRMTGFVLSDPRVIVTDGWDGNVRALRPGPITIVDSGGRRFKSRVLHHHKLHPFGPLVLEAPSALVAAGLHLNPHVVDDAMVVHAAVAAGERVGVSSGTVTSATEQSLHVAPIGPVDHLIQLKLATAPGSSGAPVTDAAFGVRGFIVAGSTDPDRPVTYMYPANRWANLL